MNMRAYSLGLLIGSLALVGCGTSAAPSSKAGQVTELDPHRTSGFHSAAPDAASRVLAAGYYIADDRSEGQMLVVRFTSDGAPDPSFGTGGLTYIAVPGETYASAVDAIEDASRRPVACGSGYSVDEEDRQTSITGVLARLGADGALDPSFGSSGLARLPLHVGLRTACYGIRQAGAYYYMLAANAGATVYGSSDIAPIPLGTVRPVDGSVFIARFDESGALDTGYADGGVYELPGDFLTNVPILEQDRAGRLYVVYGTLSEDESRYETRIARLGADGAPDLAYGDGGSALMFADDTRTSYVWDAQIDAVGRFNLVGQVSWTDPSREGDDAYRSMPMVWSVSEAGQLDEFAQRGLFETYAALENGAFFTYAPAAPRSYVALYRNDGPVEVAGLRPDGVLDRGYAARQPVVVPWKMLAVDDRVVVVGQTLRTIDGKPNAAAAIEFLPR